MKKNIALTWWATGGHVFPLLSLYNYLTDEKSKKVELPSFTWFGERDSLEEEVANKHNINFIDVPCGKIRRYFDIRNFYEPLKNLSGIIFALGALKKNKIEVVFSKWWYVSLPTCIAAYIAGIPVYIHESDVAWGLANKVISNIANKIFYTFPNELTLADEQKENPKHIHVWQILNPELLDYIEEVEIEENETMEIMVMAWSQGSTNIFSALLAILPQVSDIKFHVALGEKNRHFKEDFSKFPNVVAHDFITQKRLGKILKNIDIAICRWGATTLWETNMFGVHSIIIPLEWSAWDHQMKNADFFHQKFWSDVLIDNEDLSVELLKKLQAYQSLRKQWLNLEWFFKPLKKISKYL